MQRIGPSGATVALALLASGADAGECLARHEALVAETPDLAALPPARAVPARRTLRDLSAAARRLDAEGHEAACIATLDALARAMTDYTLAAIEREAAGTAGGADERPLPEAAPDERDPRLLPLTAPGLGFTTGELTGNSVVTYGGEHIGEVQGLRTERDGYVSHLVMGHGGFWDMFEQRAAIPVGLVRWDRVRRLVYLPLDEEELDAAPVYGAGGEWDPEANDEYYASLPE
jgi:hypothetical protein